MLLCRRLLLLVALLAAIAASLTLVAPAQAAGTGDIVGSVAGRDGELVPGAKVDVIRDGETEPVKSAYTYGSSPFRLSQLPPGDYRLRATGYSIVESWYGADAEHPRGVTVRVQENLDTTLPTPFLVTSKPALVGTVVDTAGAAAPDVSVCARPVVDGATSATDAGCGWTDASGAFTVSSLEPGTYRLFLDGEQYVRSWFGGHATPEASPTFAVAAGDRKQVGTTTVATGAVVTGRVVTPAGTPLGWAGVAAYVRDDAGRWHRDRTAQTDSAGRFRITGLASGELRVRAQDYNEVTASVPTWFPSALDADTAEPVAVTQGATTALPGDLVMRTGGTVSGRVTTSTGGTVTDPSSRRPSVTAYRWDAETQDWVYAGYANAAADGSYQVRGLPTGRYRLSASMPGYADTWAADEVSVEVGQAVTGVDIALRRLGAISGRVVDADGNRLANITVTPYTLEDGQWTPYPGDVKKTDADGNYTLTGLPAGEYRLKFEPPYSSYGYGLAPAWLGDRAIAPEESRSVRVDWESTTSVTYQTLRRLPIVTGSVTNAAGAPITSGYVMAYAKVGGSWQPSWSKQLSWETYAMQLGQTGTYKFKVAFDPHMRPAWYGGTSLATATEVTMYPGDSLRFDAVLTPASTIFGTILDDNGRPLTSHSIGVLAWTLDESTGEWVTAAQTYTSTGTFTLAGIDDLTYKIEVVTPGSPYAGTWYGGDSRETATPVRGLVQGSQALDPIQLTSGLVVTSEDPVEVTGTPIVGQTLTAVPGTWSTEPTDVVYRWRRDGVDIAEGTSYTLRHADAGHDITVTAVARKPAHKDGSSTSEPVRPTDLVATGSWRLGGRPVVGRSVSVGGGGWSVTPDAVTYQWLRAGRPIPGADGRTYRPTAADLGKKLSVRIAASRHDYLPTTVRLAFPGATKAASTTTARAVALGGRRVQLTGLVTADAVRQVAGKVTASVGSRVAGRGTLAGGKLRLLLSRLPKGKVTITVGYLGSSTVLPSTDVVRVRVR